MIFAIARRIDALPGLTYRPTQGGGNVFTDWMPDTPDLAVAVMTGAPMPQLSKLPTDLPAVQVLVRGEAQNARQALDTAKAIYADLNCLDRVTLAEGTPDEVYVVTCTGSQSGPIPIGRDDRHRPEYSLNFQLRTHAPTTHRPAAAA